MNDKQVVGKIEQLSENKNMPILTEKGINLMRENIIDTTLDKVLELVDEEKLKHYDIRIFVEELKQSIEELRKIRLKEKL